MRVVEVMKEEESLLQDHNAIVRACSDNYSLQSTNWSSDCAKFA